ncbi:MAG: PD-(D/E)XK nuclease family protein, partial [Prevotella sp.]|nr:PD-(D/E)XK nuclease family protein [Prevotella sp.]
MYKRKILGYDQQRQRYRKHYLVAVMRHPYIAQIPTDEADLLVKSNEDLLLWLCNILQRIALVGNTNDPLYQESVFRVYTLINRLKGLVDSGDLTVDNITMQRLINQLIQSTSVPFHGEPVEGLQVMGLLETRNLDFDHIILLSCNEGNMPRGINDTSFIPYSIRKAYGLTTVDHKVAIYSYYFHRLLQRASSIMILYNNSTADGQTGEMSRFMRQMMVEDRQHDIRFQTLQVPAALPHNEPPIIRMEKKKAVSFLSPTAINTYMRCPLRYYYKYECGLLEPEEEDGDTIDNRVFGNIFHEASQIVYQRLMDKSHQILTGDIDYLLKNRVDIVRAVDEAMQKELGKIDSLSGLQIINRE